MGLELRSPYIIGHYYTLEIDSAYLKLGASLDGIQYRIPMLFHHYLRYLNNLGTV
jgi:hypothetical protein